VYCGDSRHGCGWGNIPVATARAVLLHLFGVDIGEAVLAKEARHSFRGEDSPLGNALVVTVIGLVGSGHYRKACQYTLSDWVSSIKLTGKCIWMGSAVVWGGY
jgi:hypothetical protein